MAKSLSKMQSDFIYYFSQTGNATQSAIKAGYKKTNADKMGYELKNRYSQQIEDEIKKQLSGSVPMALNRIVTLAENAKQESISLQASKDILVIRLLICTKMLLMKDQTKTCKKNLIVY